MIVSRTEAAQFHREVGTALDLCTPEVRDQLREALALEATDYIRGLRLRGQLRENLVAATSGVDVLVSRPARSWRRFAQKPTTTSSFSQRIAFPGAWWTSRQSASTWAPPVQLRIRNPQTTTVSAPLSRRVAARAGATSRGSSPGYIRQGASTNDISQLPAEFVKGND